VSGGYGPGGYPGYDEDPQRTWPRRQGGYDDPAYSDQQYSGQQYGGQQYDGQAYGDYDRYGDPGHDPRGYSQPAGGYGQRRDAGYQQQGGHDDWQQEQRDDSFMPGFGGRADYDDGYDDRRARRGGRDGRGPNGANGRGPRDDWNDRNVRPRKKVTRWFPRILILTVVVAIVVGGLVGGLSVYHKYEARYHPADYVGQGSGDVTVQVASGDTAFSLAPKLLQLGIIASTRAFTNAAEAAPSTGLEAGYYQLHYHMQASLAYAALLNPKNLVQTIVTIPEGKRVSQVLTILAAGTKIPLSQFESAAKDTAALGLPSYAGSAAAGVKLPATVPYGKLEGYLFPATYAITPHETALQILQAMVQRFDVEAQAINIQQAAQSVGLTPDQLIIEASMVQAEAGINSDMPKMARVMLNRKARGMPYGFDSVVFYGLGKYGINISPDQATAAGVYNDTQQLGLPPTPIGNPGDLAIQAVLHPASGPWLYFLTEAGGKASTFSATCLPGTCG
jgi:UPF0755 protein